MRKLASIQIISDIQPIEGKDRIVLATVEGWHVIIKKDEFVIGDQCVYCEIDSVMPDKPEFAFLKSPRIKTMRMAGCLSQGICFPMSILPSGTYEIGQDVTSVIGITQYEPEMDNDKDVSDANRNQNKSFMMRFNWYRKLFGKKSSKSSFPSFISKTDETRIQNAPFMLNDKSPYIITEKVDGSSGTFALVRHRFLFWDRYEYMVCSRNLRLKEDDGSIYWKVSNKYKIKETLMNLIGNRNWIAIQGECIGPKVQGNKYGVLEPYFYAFNLIDPNGRKDSLYAKAFLETRGIDFVPIINTDFTLPDTVDEMVAMADGMSQISAVPREGFVVRSKDGKQSFKAVSNAFLLAHKL